MVGKHRLIFLGTLLVGLLLFYFGVNTWMEQKAKENIPPPIVIKHPEEKAEDQVKDEKSLQPTSQTPSQEKLAQKSQPKGSESFKQKPETQKFAVKEQKSVNKVERKVKESKEMKTVAKKETQRKTETQPRKSSQKLKTYVFQVGAFKNRANALRMVEVVKRKGFNAKLVKKGELYKVYVYTKAPSYAYAYRKVKRHFREAFPVRN